MVPSTDDAHIEWANWLFVRLVALLVGTGVVNVLFGSFVRESPWFAGSLVSLLGLLVANLAALWLGLHLVFSAFNGILEAKLE